MTIRFGKPFYPQAVERITSQAAKDATDDIMVHIAEMLPVEYQGEYREAVAARTSKARALAEEKV